MKHLSLLSLALFSYAASSCMEEITLSDGTNTVKRRVSASKFSQEKNNFCDINVINKTNWTIQAQIKGFGAKDINSEFEDYELNTGGVNIASQKIYPFSILTGSAKFPYSSTLYRLYAHALIIKFQDNKSSEIHFSKPLDANFRDFVVTSYDTNQGPRLRIGSSLDSDK